MSIGSTHELRTALDRALAGGAAAGRWRLAPDRSILWFRVRSRWGFKTVHGSFRSATGAGELTPDGLVRADLAIQAGSVHTGNATWDARLRSAAFFDTERHPDLIVAVTAADRTGHGRLLLTGSLTVAETTRPVTLTAEVIMIDDVSVRLLAQFEISRADLGLGWNRFGLIGDKVRAHADVYFTRSDDAEAAPDPAS